MAKKNNDLTYEQAYRELQEIQSALENEEVSIDQLAEKVKRAQELVAHCQQKLRTTEDELKKITP